MTLEEAKKVAAIIGNDDGWWSDVDNMREFAQRAFPEFVWTLKREPDPLRHDGLSIRATIEVEERR